MRFKESFFLDVISKRKIIISMAKMDLQNRNLGTFLGIFWVFLNPLFSMLIILAVFEFGIRPKSDSIQGSVAWLICGLTIWQILAEGITSVTTAIIDKPYLVKKIKFDLDLLPLVKILNSLKIGAFFIAFLFIVSLAHGSINVTGLWQIPYYIFALAFLLISIGFLTSSVVVFYKDFQNIVALAVQLGFWCTPILWDYKIFETYKVTWILKFHPFHYIIQGFRESILGGPFFYEHIGSTLIFWIEVLLLFVLSRRLFNKLRPGFADVL